MKKKRASLIFILLFIVAGVIPLVIVAGRIWIDIGEKGPIQVEGNLSAEDIAGIRSLVRGIRAREIMRGIIHDGPRSDFKHLREVVHDDSRFKIKVIHVTAEGHVEVEFGYPGFKGLYLGCYQKGTFGWEIDTNALNKL